MNGKSIPVCITINHSKIVCRGAWSWVAFLALYRYI